MALFRSCEMTLAPQRLLPAPIPRLKPKNVTDRPTAPPRGFALRARDALYIPRNHAPFRKSRPVPAPGGGRAAMDGRSGDCAARHWTDVGLCLRAPRLSAGGERADH